MKTEIYVLAVSNPLSGKLSISGRGTRHEVLELLIARIVPELWADNALEKAKKALADEQYDVVEAIIGNNILLNFEIEKIALEVQDPEVAKLKKQLRVLRKHVPRSVLRQLK